MGVLHLSKMAALRARECLYTEIGNVLSSISMACSYVHRLTR